MRALKIAVENKWFQLFTVIVWLAFIKKSDSYFIVYLVVGFSGIICRSFCGICKVEAEKKYEWINMILASIFSLAVIAANYKIFSGIMIPDISRRILQIFKLIERIVTFPVVFMGGCISMFYILQYLKQKASNFVWREYEYRLSEKIVFGGITFSIAAMNTMILFLCFYPGILTPDSINQINQILNGMYSNHHPFYHTMVIRFWLIIGMKIFGNINAAVATYSMFLIIFMASVFSYASLTLYQMRINKKMIIAVTANYMFLPYHICYSMTMWKDVMFGGWVLVFCVSIFRYMKGIGSRKSINIGLTAVSALGICLFRSNGFFAFGVTFAAFISLVGKQYKKLSFLFLGVIIIAYLLKHPVLEHLEVTQPDTIEALSIPVQQISRVIKDNNDLTDEQRKLLFEVIDIDKITDMYLPYISDPIKALVREKGNQIYLLEHKWEYLELYIKIGLSHPLKYMEAWIDQTKGYWEGGNSYWIWSTEVCDNQFGIERKTYSKITQELMELYLWCFRNIEVLKLFLSIGFHTWVTVLIGYVAYVKENKDVIFLTTLILAIIVSLLVATPVYSEFRYIYAMFCCTPFLGVISFWKCDI